MRRMRNQGDLCFIRKRMNKTAKAVKKDWNCEWLDGIPKERGVWTAVIDVAGRSSRITFFRIRFSSSFVSCPTKNITVSNSRLKPTKVTKATMIANGVRLTNASR